MPVSTIPVGFVDKFRGDYILLSQQKESRLWNTVRHDPDMLQGRFGYYDYIGSVSMYQRTSRHQDTGVVEVPHSRRRITLADYELPHLLDKQDVMRLVADPQGKYMQNMIAAANRKKDDIIINAWEANAQSVDENMAATPIALPNGQIITEGGTAGLTVTKLLKVKEILDAAEIDEDEGRTAVVGSRQITDLLNTTEIKSADYNTVKALAEGRINDFMGFRFIRIERLNKTGNMRRCGFYGKNAIGIAVGEDFSVSIDPRPDKGNATQLLGTMSADATRIEDKKIVVVESYEAP
ncbi:phage capsid protein [Ferrovibrio sp.]|uniref:phage capsid protein n=1 Tax=Ferrovibrio sp. TaxID=1917215 RepID=UPI003D0D0D74